MPGDSATLAQQTPPAAYHPPLGSWAVQHAGELGALRAAVRAAMRRSAESEPGSAGDPVGRQRLLLVVSELTTNALKYGADPVTVSLYRSDGAWLLDVVDGNADAPPVLHRPDRTRVGRNGLLIIDRASTTWGWYRDRRDPRLKHVWAAVAH